MGFSKGSVVLNQFLHEFHYYENPQEQNDEIVKFISRIKEMWWLDGGHPGQKDTWITDKTILDSFIKLGKNLEYNLLSYNISISTVFRKYLQSYDFSLISALAKFVTLGEKTFNSYCN